VNVANSGEDTTISTESQTPDVMEKLVKLTEALNKKDDNISDDNSYASSQNSRLSEKNMADFEGEESDNELTQIDVTGSGDQYFDDIDGSNKSSAAHKLASIAQQIVKQQLKPEIQDKSDVSDENNVEKIKADNEENELVDLSIENVCKPGRTLLWDLLQDDMIHQLAEGLAHETEKIFWNTVCWSSDRRIRMKFIDGCLDNLSKNYSVNTSLRLLPKFLMSFQQYRGGMDTHQILLWADKERQMLKHFFTNLIIYSKNRKKSSFNKSDCSISSIDNYSHTEEIQTRLNFLSFVFSCAGSPDDFRLSQEQIDILWSTLATDPESADELFNWLLGKNRS
jgi:ubiquitin carboxyl-terminal hydrolase 34